MYIGYTDEQKALRDELRAYYEAMLTDEIQDELSRSEGVGPDRKSTRLNSSHT